MLCLSHVGAKRRLQKGLKFCQRVAVHNGWAGEPRVITNDRLKHPGRHFQRSVSALVVEAAPTDGISALGQRLVHHDSPTEPRMPRIADFSSLGTMGVALSTCITVIARMRGWTGARRNRTLTRTAHARASARIDGSRTVAGCIRRRSRRDVCATDAPLPDRTFRLVDRLHTTVCAVSE